MWNRAPLVVFAILTFVAAVAGYCTRLIVPPHDKPAPASLSREELVLEIDLTPRISCDEAFDLALYRHLGIERIAWDPNGARSCRGRRVTVKYLPSRIGRAALLERIERLAVSVKVVEG